MEDVETATDKKLSLNAAGEKNAATAASTDEILREAEVVLKGKGCKLKMQKSGLQLVHLKSKSGQNTVGVFMCVCLCACAHALIHMCLGYFCAHACVLVCTFLCMYLSVAVSAETSVLNVAWVDIVCACEISCKKSKGNAGPPSQNNAEAQQLCRKFAIHYIARKVGSKKLFCRNVVLETKNEPADEWISQIEERCKVGKPKKLLVVINPISGSGTARQTFEKFVQPLFVLAGIDLVVKVTERARHAEEIGKMFDFSSVDGVVIVGGDGLYMEVLHGAVVKKQEENGIDYNNPDASLVPPSVTFGIIPAGTGNGISLWWNGVKDVRTATLNIIRGESHLANMLAIFEPGKLVHYSALHLGYAYFSELIKKAEEMRWMKKARYAYAILTTIFAKKRVYDIEMEVLVSSEKQENQQASEVVSPSPEFNWKKLGVKQVIWVVVLPFEIVPDETTDKVHVNSLSDKTSAFFAGPFGGIEILRFLKTVAARDKAMMEKSYIGHYPTKGMKLKFVPNGESHMSNAEEPRLENILNIDGEVFVCSVPEIDIRFHAQFVRGFCALPD